MSKSLDMDHRGAIRSPVGEHGEQKAEAGMEGISLEAVFPGLQRILEALPFLVHVQRGDCRILAANTRFLEHFGDPQGRCLGQILAESGASCESCLIRKSILGGDGHPLECAGRSGHIYQIYGKPLAGDSQGPLVLVTAQDISSQRWSEAALCKVEERLRIIADYTCDWESWFGVEGNLVWVSPSVERITGYTVAECMNMERYPLPMVQAEDRDGMKRILIRFESHPECGEDYSFRIVHRDGRIRWISMSWQPVFNTNRDYLGIRSGMRDVTMRKESEEKEKKEHSELAVFRERLGYLTNREREVMQCVALGKPNKIIAQELGVSPKTVEIHRSRVMGKLQVHSVADLVRVAIRTGMV